MLKENIFSHYRKEEQSFVEKIIDVAAQVSQTQQPYLTDFVDLRQLHIIKNIVNSFMDLAMFFDGGYEAAERVRIFIAPEYWYFQEEDSNLAFFSIKGENKFHRLNHRDYLGAILNLGLKREKFGDLLLSEREKQVVVAKEIADYVQFQLNQVGKTKVELQRIDREQLIPPVQKLEEINFSVSSLRIDTVTAHVFKQSRAKVADFIKGKNLKVNWQVVDQVDFTLEPGDIISLKGFGRYKFLEQEGNTKKGRFRIKIGKLV